KNQFTRKNYLHKRFDSFIGVVMETKLNYLNVTEKHFLNRLALLQSMNQINTSKPALLYFTTEDEDDGKFHSYIILEVYNNLIHAETCLKTPFLISSDYKRSTDEQAWLTYRKWVNEDSAFFQNLLDGLKDDGFREVRVLEPTYHSELNDIYNLRLRTKQQKNLQANQIKIIYRFQEEY
ncbi:MAG: hypothetical protein N4R16_04230, partial [Lactobacillus crispatus]|nr:hypothetical protein [Lactobacillus crispatus]MCT7802175.1 hypothetical protein [Lactobacillus crispatus]